MATNAGGREAAPPGYRESAAGGARLVAREAVHAELRTALDGASLHAWAAARPGARSLEGRTVAWAVALDSGTRVVVRHGRHGGVFGDLTRDLFLAPSRAPAELDTSLRLQAAGVPTPDVLAYATYATFGPLCRVDVVTACVEGTDLPAAWTAASPTERPGIIAAAGTLLRQLCDAGAVHADLNAKNILIGWNPARAWVLDVDRVTFPREPGGVMMANLRRLARSLTKWRAQRGLAFGQADWLAIVDAAGAADEGGWHHR